MESCRQSRWGHLVYVWIFIGAFLTCCQVLLYLDRIVSDHDSVPEPLRKALTFKDAVRLHQAAGSFLYFLRELEKIAPSGQFPEMETTLRSQFSSKFLDGDLVHVLEDKLPATSDLSSPCAFRPNLLQVHLVGLCWDRAQPGVRCWTPKSFLWRICADACNGRQLDTLLF